MRYMQMGDPNQAAHSLNLYSIIDPKNSEPAYLKAVLMARGNQAAECRNALAQAIQLGFNDRERLKKQAEFQGMGLESLFSN
jgi:Flp pilus assembly protein TadD